MGTSNYSDEFKRDAVHQIAVRGYPVREVSRRLGVSTHSLYKWMKLFGDPTPITVRDMTCGKKKPYHLSGVHRAASPVSAWWGSRGVP